MRLSRDDSIEVKLRPQRSPKRMNSEKILAIAGVALLLWTTQPVASPADSSKTIAIDACYVGGDQHEVVFRMRGELSGSAIVRGDQLPWGADGIVFVPYEENPRPGKFIRRVYPIEDDFSDDVTLAGKFLLSGSVWLQARYPELDERALEKGVVVLWYYRVQWQADRLLSGAFPLKKGGDCQ